MKKVVALAIALGLTISVSQAAFLGIEMPSSLSIDLADIATVNAITPDVGDIGNSIGDGVSSVGGAVSSGTDAVVDGVNNVPGVD